MRRFPVPSASQTPDADQQVVARADDREVTGLLIGIAFAIALLIPTRGHAAGVRFLRSIVLVYGNGRGQRVVTAPDMLMLLPAPRRIRHQLQSRWRLAPILAPIASPAKFRDLAKRQLCESKRKT